ncbi:MAG: DNA-binding protein [Nitrospirae bacterium]|nr:MAG: DNA-binding protein [Nitrospirota bacterium]
MNTQKIEPERLMTVHEVAAYLAVTERTVYRLLRDREFPALRVGGQWRFNSNMIEKWMQKESAGAGMRSYALTE